jgi:hypothetical protein
MLTTAETEAVLAPTQLRMADLISALSFALDLTEGQPMGHAVKSCVLSMRLAEILQLPVQQKSDLYYATLLKDAGCSSNSARMYEILGGDERKAKQEVKATDWTRITFEGLEYLMRPKPANSSASAAIAARRSPERWVSPRAPLLPSTISTSSGMAAAIPNAARAPTSPFFRGS